MPGRAQPTSPRNALRRVFRRPSMLGTSRHFHLAKVRRTASSHRKAARRSPRRYRALRRRTPSRRTRTSPRCRYPGTAAGCRPRTSATPDSRPTPFARFPLPRRLPPRVPGAGSIKSSRLHARPRLLLSAEPSISLSSAQTRTSSEAAVSDGARPYRSVVRAPRGDAQGRQLRRGWARRGC